MAVQMRVRRSPSRTPRAVRVTIFGGHDLPRGLLDHLPAVAAAHCRHRLGQMRHRLADCRGVRGLHVLSLASSPSAHTALTDFGALNVKSIPPPRPPPAPLAEAIARPRVAALHQRDEVPALDCGVLDPSRASVSGVASHRPGAWVGSPSGSGSSRRAPASTVFDSR